MSDRQQRRRFERQLRKLIRAKGDNCSLCDAEFQHNSRSFGGYDQDGKIALVGECCVERLLEVHTVGLFSRRNYDFLPAGQDSMTRGLGREQAVNAVGALERAIAFADEEIKDDLWQRGGMSKPPHPLVSILDHAWKKDDRGWFRAASRALSPRAVPVRWRDRPRTVRVRTGWASAPPAPAPSRAWQAHQGRVLYLQ